MYRNKQKKIFLEIVYQKFPFKNCLFKNHREFWENPNSENILLCFYLRKNN